MAKISCRDCTNQECDWFFVADDNATLLIESMLHVEDTHKEYWAQALKNAKEKKGYTVAQMMDYGLKHVRPE